MVTNGDDPVVDAEWSPATDWLAITIAPGGGLNTQVYVVKRDGTGLRRLTDGGKDNNGFDAWTEDGTKIAIDSSRQDPAARDSFLIDVGAGEIKLVAKNPGVGSISNISHNGKRALLDRLRSRGDNNLYLLDLVSNKDILLTSHQGIAEFFGVISPDGSTIYLGSNKDRDLSAFARIRIGADGAPGAVEILAERPDAELDDVRINKQGTLAALIWNVKGKSELAFYDLAKNSPLQAPMLPGELAGGVAFSSDGKKLALTVSGSAQPADIWILDLASNQFR
jgi:Tol biopolymer transport system component